MLSIIWRDSKVEANGYSEREERVRRDLLVAKIIVKTKKVLKEEILLAW